MSNDPTPTNTSLDNYHHKNCSTTAEAKYRGTCDCGLNEAVEAQVQQGKREAVAELKRRWHEDRKTMDYSPATYDFICDQYLAALQSQAEEQ